MYDKEVGRIDGSFLGEASQAHAHCEEAANNIRMLDEAGCDESQTREVLLDAVQKKSQWRSCVPLMSSLNWVGDDDKAWRRTHRQRR